MELHIPVMLRESIEALEIKPDGRYLDATFGRGGHSLEILKRLDTGRLYAFDKDKDALTEGLELIRSQMNPDGRLELIHSDFRRIADFINEGLDGILFDLGVSSPQLDRPERGFSYKYSDAPLDMRQDTGAELTAETVVNEYERGRLETILRDYGEERYARAIAGGIVRHRAEKRIKSTGELAEIIRASMPAAGLREEQHPARRSFQAIRIEVNDELNALKEALDAAIGMLLQGGVLCVISFHSLEDRIVKQKLNEMSTACRCPKDFPVCVCGGKAVMTRQKLYKPNESNPRARSARLRTAKRI